MPSKRHKEKQGSEFRVLIVEDELAVQQDLKCILETKFQHIDVAAAASVREALAAIQRAASEDNGFDLGILDFKLPSAEGMQINVDTSVCNAFRKLETPIVHITAWADDPAIRQHMQEVHPASIIAPAVLVDKTATPNWVDRLIGIVAPYSDTITAHRFGAASVPVRSSIPRHDVPQKMFCSYSHKDERMRSRLETHLTVLQNQGLISEWHDRKITPGSEWEGEIDANLNSANVVLFLVSPDFLASRYCCDVEVTVAMRRHDKGQARVIPVILRPVDWKSVPFCHLQALPTNGKPVTAWNNYDRAFFDIEQGIRTAIAEML